ncbi:MAG TPA: aminopeptidase P family protein [Propionibacteriaceae bacterium]|nr:aminopeptidase P family protein [Propionibacteriaceae bacterium]
MSEKQPTQPNRQPPFSEAFQRFIAEGWAPYSTEPPAPLAASTVAPARRQRVSELFPGDRLVIPAGGLRVRSNDTDYRFRPHSAFAHLTGLGTDREPGAVLVLEPTDSGHQATLYFKPRAPRDSAEFYSDARYGEMWVGVRPSLDEMSSLCGIDTAAIDDLRDDLGKNADDTRIRVLPGADQDLDALVESVRQRTEETADLDAELAVALSELRLVKDSFEIDQLRAACASTAAGFEAVVAALPDAVRRGTGERWVEGIFGLHARHEGNAVGYDTIAAAGDHACTLHWIRNDGDLHAGDLLLLDAGVELDTLYTADITRTLPISGRFTDDQRRVYEAVLAAQEAGIAAAQPGAAFSDVHAAAIAVIARYLQDWGVLPITAEESLSDDGGLHRRWMVHGTSHHLGIDVHDCAQARVENYRRGTLKPGMVITVEPGLYFKSSDLLVPPELRGIGIRIEDDILITEDGNENLSGGLPRTSSGVESWMADIWKRSGVQD